MLARYLSELALVDYSMLCFTPKEVAAASIFISRQVMKLNPAWSESLEGGSSMTEETIKRCVTQLISIWEGAGRSSLKAVRLKYSEKKFMEVSKLEEQENKECC